MKYDILIREANLYYGKGVLKENMDLAITDGRIAGVGRDLNPMDAEKVIEAKGQLVSPGFVDSHMHIDLSYTFDYETKIPSLIGGCKQFKTIFDENAMQPAGEVRAMIDSNSSRTIEACVANGTTALKTNVSYETTWKTLGMESAIYIKKKYERYCNVLNVVCFTNQFPPEMDPSFYDEVLPYLEQAASEGKADFIGGYPHKHPDGPAVIDSVFARSEKYGVPIDIHCDETDTPILTCFDYVTRKTKETGMQGKVTCGHVTGLAGHDMDEDTAKRLIAQAAEADVNVTSLTSCNLYLMNSNRRGPTRVRELLDAGVNVSVASDDIQEILRPFGNCDLLEEALLSAQIHKMGTTSLLRQAFDMVTYNPARNCLLARYGLEKGCDADLVILDAPTPEDALLDQAGKPYVFKNGRIVAMNGQLVPGFLN